MNRDMSSTSVDHIFFLFEKKNIYSTFEIGLKHIYGLFEGAMNT